ncbi:MAG: prepilin-type N-terminal cleavage/methylation domain-containing protein [Anaerolineae bacterium]|nr:prepilin-type N-terminal cleavage/methylation domain-containing protein [Phycisphaerae bacterium]
MTRRASGFTLLELILATAAAAVIAFSLYSAMSTGFRARTIAQLQSADLRTATIALDLIEQDLQSVLPPTGTLAGSFIGFAAGSPGAEADTLELHTIGRDANTELPLSEGFRRVLLTARNDGLSTILVRQVTRNLLTDAPPQPEEEILAANVVGFSIRYYDSDTATWAEEWDSTQLENAMPTAVSVTVRVRRADANAADPVYALTRLIPLACGGPAATATTTTPAGG